MSTGEPLPLLSPSTPWEEAQATLDACDLSDGLPVVPPTGERLDRMLAGVSDPDRSYGQLWPLCGELTPAAVAYQCVLAGCVRGELPVVMSALVACLEPEFNLLGILTTTGTPAVALLVHGPAARALGLNASTNCLGPGNRANACIGRALSLALRNIGGAREGVGDMATMGQPGKYTFCFAEGEGGGFEPLPARRGFAAGASAVTVLGVSGTLELLPATPGDSPELILEPAAAAMAVALSVTGAARKPERGEQVLLLPPELATFLAQQHWGLSEVQGYLFERAGALSQASGGPSSVAISPAHISPVVTGGPGVKMTYLPLWGGGTRSVTRAIESV